MPEDQSKTDLAKSTAISEVSRAELLERERQRLWELEPDQDVPSLSLLGLLVPCRTLWDTVCLLAGMIGAFLLGTFIGGIAGLAIAGAVLDGSSLDRALLCLLFGASGGLFFPTLVWWERRNLFLTEEQVRAAERPPRRPPR
jgi:hypothetical protein